MSKAIVTAAGAAVLFAMAGCGQEGEYETYVRELNRNLPDVFSKPLVEKTMDDFRKMSASEQKQAIKDVKAKLGK